MIDDVTEPLRPNALETSTGLLCGAYDLDAELRKGKLFLFLVSSRSVEVNSGILVVLEALSLLIIVRYLNQRLANIHTYAKNHVVTIGDKNL